MVTLPSEAALDRDFATRLARAGVDAVRINCAHDDETAWGRMIAHVGAAAVATGRRMKVLMDLPGLKIRTGESREGKDHDRIRRGDELAITRPGRLRSNSYPVMPGLIRHPASFLHSKTGPRIRSG